MKICWNCCGLLIALFALTCCGRVFAQEVLDIAIKSNQSTVEGMHSVQFHFESMSEVLARDAIALPNLKGDFWKSGEFQRFTYDEDALSQTVIIRPENIVVIGHNKFAKTGEFANQARIGPNSGFRSISFSLWRDALLAFDGPKGIGCHNLKETVENYLKSPVFNMTDRLATISGGNGITSLILDLQKNHLVAGRIVRMTDKAGRGAKFERVVEERVTSFIELAPGLYFPDQIIVENKLGNVIQTRRTIRISKIRINDLIDQSVFIPAYRNDTEVLNLIDKTRYVVDKFGKIVSDITPIKQYANGPPDLEYTKGYRAPSSVEEYRWGWWIAPLGLGVAGMGIVYHLIALRRNQGNQGIQGNCT